MPANCYRTLIVAAICTLVAPWCHAGQPLTSAQALAYVRISDLQFSPDGSKLAYVVSSYQWDALPRIQVATVASGRTLEITPPGQVRAFTAVGA
jgi:hypothetical protein